MPHLIIIGGTGGAGKETLARLLYEHLSPCAWVDAKALVRVQPWQFGPALHALSMRNAAALAHNFYAAGFDPTLLSGGVVDQASLDLLQDLLPAGTQVDYLFLHADKAVRDARRLSRARDDADLREHLDTVDRVMPDPGPLVVRGGRYQRLDTTHLAPEQVLAVALQLLGCDT